MIAQGILTALLSVILIYAWVAYARSPVVGVLSVFAALTGIYFVWMPSHAMAIAEWAGIGRGVDLIIDLWVVISFIILLNLHLKIRAQMELITVIARSTAIAQAMLSSVSRTEVASVSPMTITETR